MTAKIISLGGTALGVLAASAIVFTLVMQSLPPGGDMDGVIVPASGGPGGANGRRVDVNAPIQPLTEALNEAGPFDRFLLGDARAISASEARGYDLFVSLGCAACHQGRLVGGNMYQRFGIFGNPFADRGTESTANFGRFNVTGDDSDRYVFKVASLRDVVGSAPYFHDGSAPTLHQAVRVMARYQLGRTLDPDEVADIVAFLGALSGSEQ